MELRPKTMSLVIRMRKEAGHCNQLLLLKGILGQHSQELEANWTEQVLVSTCPTK